MHLNGLTYDQCQWYSEAKQRGESDEDALRAACKWDKSDFVNTFRIANFRTQIHRLVARQQQRKAVFNASEKQIPRSRKAALTSGRTH